MDGKSKRPQVLLAGNGLVWTDRRSWGKMIKGLTRGFNDYEEREDEDSFDDVPYPLQIVIRSGNQVDKVLNRGMMDLFGEVSTDDNDRIRTRLCEVLDLGLDEILTTNYSYEFEIAGYKKKVHSLTRKQVGRMRKHTEGVKRQEAKYRIYTYNQVGDNRIWHVHGEAAVPRSVVIGHQWYVDFVHRYQQQIMQVNNYRPEKGRRKTDFSWLGSFLRGDVYILGFDFDYSEIDLWWLLSKKQEYNLSGRTDGRVCYYGPRNNDGRKYDSKEELLRAYEVEVSNLDDFTIDNEAPLAEKEKLYDQFYHQAIEDIAKRMKKRRG
ncbi:MAG: SIR2 family protein [Anaerovoracaceae bacterium]